MLDTAEAALLKVGMKLYSGYTNMYFETYICVRQYLSPVSTRVRRFRIIFQYIYLALPSQLTKRR